MAPSGWWATRLLDEQLHQDRPDLILLDISDGSWHIGLPGVKTLTDAYPDSKLIPIHWGCVRSDWREFNGDPYAVKDMITNPDRMTIAAAGQEIRLEIGG